MASEWLQPAFAMSTEARAGSWISALRRSAQPQHHRLPARGLGRGSGTRQPRISWPGAALAALGLLAGWLYLTASIAGAAEQRPWPQGTVPPLVFSAADGSRTDLGGPGKVRVINFWAVWCGPCREELPALQRLADGLKGQPVEVVLVNTGDSPRAIATFMDKLPARLQLRSLRDAGDTVIGGGWNFKQLPATAILDRHGRVRWTVIGKLDEQAEPVRARVAEVLRER